MRPHRVLGSALLLLALGVTGTAWAGAREALQAFTAGLKGLDGQFRQQVFDARGRPKESTQGRVALAAPNRLRWEAQAPYAQLVLADGRTVWVYEPDLNQVSKRPQGVEESGSPLALLLEPARLERDYQVRELPSQDGLDWLEIAPLKADAAFKSARLGFAGDQLRQLEYTDALGQRTVIHFSGWRRNPAFAADTFRFTPPKGVDVIGGD
ncbi:outer membrane lipoprotein chaperone LolA [Thermomonas hydrothermalis]|uniref:Outer-membrane lipoprotein carrier protein n=1 Tax=Thermomonas hydrothermalis TaxID=213588 RepID=A0A1M4VFW6_9GAMM|nr:outer membrane lipoprotein chaperone LolA [Thermomonas hydrothermalis]SHE67760.1 outer membrane lipoprotein carrier protein [Thermomonas hydrothermalis]